MEKKGDAPDISCFTFQFQYKPMKGKSTNRERGKKTQNLVMFHTQISVQGDKKYDFPTLLILVCTHKLG